MGRGRDMRTVEAYAPQQAHRGLPVRLEEGIVRRPPSVQGDSISAPETCIRMLAELDRKRVVHVEARPETLKYSRIALLCAREGQEPPASRKRAQPIGVPGIRYDKRRRAGRYNL